MSHDVLAELQGYRDELAGAEAYGREDHAARVRPEIDRVRAVVEAQAAAAELRAAAAEATGQDASAHHAEVRRYRDALGDDVVETTEDTTTRERATTRKAK